MKNIKSKILLSFTGALAIASMLVFCLCSVPVTRTDALAQNSAFSKNITIDAHNYEDNIETAVNESPITLIVSGGTEKQNYSRKSYNWQSVKYLTFKMDTSSITTESVETFTYSYHLTWAPELITEDALSLDTAHAYEQEIAHAEVTSVDDIPSEFTLYLDETVPTEPNTFSTPTLFEEKYPDVGGCWGIYFFTFTLNGAAEPESSSIIEILPTDVHTLSQSQIVVEQKTGSKSGLRYWYTFSIEDEAYRFVDREQIKWFVSGTSNEGKSYVLEEGDAADQNFLYSAGEKQRKGFSFDFDPRITGKWSVSYKIYETDRVTEIANLNSESQDISTVKGLSQQSIIWIVVGAAAAAGIIVAVVIIVSIKREKVY